MSIRTASLAFLTRVLEARTLADEYPLLFDARFVGTPSGGEIVELVEQGEVRAACGVLARDFRVGPHAFRGGLIGSVATDPEWRRQGLATRLLARAEDELRARGCLFALLWADDPGFYLKRGYAPFGSECDFMLVSELARTLPAASGVRELRAGDAPCLQHLHALHPTRVERSLDETRALFGVPGMLTLVRERASAAGQPARPVAYAALGRGRDLTDAIHDWAGEPEDVLALLRAHLERRFPSAEPGALFLMTPADAGALGERLTKLGALAQRGILGLGKLLDGERAGELVGAVIGALEAAAWRGTTLELRGPRAGARLDLEGLQALLFGAPAVRDEVRSLLARLGFERAGLPLEPFAFGLDSI